MRTIADIYNGGPDYEWNRLTKSPYNVLEFTAFMHHVVDGGAPAVWFEMGEWGVAALVEE
jgi:hypothetical protein